MLVGVWQERLKAKFDSDAKAARRLFPDWKKRKPAEVKQDATTEVALANQIGKLRRRGDATGWWRARPVLRQLLADLLGVEAHDIFKAAAAERGAIGFREFPALPALEPDERPCHLGGEGGVFEDAVAALRGSRSWLKVPPGGGKSLAIELLRRRRASDVLAVSVRSLRELLALPDDRALVAEVEESLGGADREALESLRGRSHALVVLAPFASPEPPAAFSDRDWSVLDGDWLERMVRWIAERLERSPRDTKLEVDEVLTWIRASEARERMIRTPGDLLALCADFDQHGAGGSLAERGHRWLDTHGAAWLPADAPAAWRSGIATDAYRELVRGELVDVSMAHGHRSRARWSELLPARLDPGPARGAPGRDVVIAHFAQAGLLRGGEHGLEPYPRWVGGAIAQQAIQESFKRESLARWGALAADASRRTVVDGALDELPDPALRGLRRKVLASAGSSPSLGQIGAVEATLAASARRIADRQMLAPGEDPQELQELLLEQLRYTAPIRGPGERPIPLTRRELDEWHATGWAISLFTPPPASPVPVGLEWVLPGWASSLGLDQAPHWLPWSTKDPWGASAGVRRLVRLAPRLLERFEPGVVPEGVPRIFLPALLLSAADWRLGERHLDVLAGSWEETFLADEVRRRSSLERAAVARRLWRAAGAWSGGDAEAPVERRVEIFGRPPARWVLEHLPAEDIQETARTAGISDFDNGWRLRWLPPALRSAALRGWVQAGEGRRLWSIEARELLQLADAVDLEPLLEDLRTAAPGVARQLIPFIWSASPDRALDEARAALERGFPSVETWFYQAPREHLGRLADALSMLEVRPHWAASWALHRLLDAGPAAEQLLALSRGG